MLKKVIYTISLLLVALIATFFIWRYASYARDRDPYKMFLLPRLELSELQIASISAKKIDLTAKLLIKNQIPISFIADSFQYQVYINNTQVMKDHYEKSIEIKSDQISSVSLPITLLRQDLVEVLKAGARDHLDSAEYIFHITFFTHIPFKKDFTIDIKRYLPLLRMVEIKEDHLAIQSFNFSTANLELTISINNPNVFPLQAKNIAYAVTIEGTPLAKGTIAGVSEIKAKSDSELKIPITVSVGELGKTLFDLLKNSKSVSCTIHLSFQIDSHNNMFKNSTVILESDGSVKSLLKAITK
jgi:LEA14-like dessication related protein